MKTILTTIVVWFVFVSNQVSAQEKQFTTEPWVEDLNYVVTQLKDHHPHIYYRISEEKFNTNVINATKEIKATKTDLECYFVIKKVVAGIQDGHTQLFDRGTLGIDNLRFPFRLDKFTDGAFITVIRKDYKKFLGAKVISINGKSIEQVLKLTSAITNIDNEFGKIRSSVQDITFARTMFGLGITNSEKIIELELITKDGKRENIEFESIFDTSPILWSNRLNMAPAKGDYISIVNLLGDKTPLHLKKQGDNIEFYWFEHLKKEKAIYFQYNQVANQRDHYETWVEFTNRIWQYIDSHKDEIDKLIIDIRYNDGGNGRTMVPFINQIIKRDKFCNGKNLLVLTSNRTYSAAVILMTELAVHTDAIFIGSPAGCPFNFFSDMEIVDNLPNSGAGLGIASRQIDNAWSHQTVFFQPDFPAPFSSNDYFSGKDPTLALALKGLGLKNIAEFAADNCAEDAFVYYHQLKKKYANIDWWTGLNPEILENNINNDGYTLLGRRELKSAFEVFKLNTLIFPKSANAWDSFAEWYYNEKKFEFAVKYYKKSLELNPNNENAINMIKRIENER